MKNGERLAAEFEEHRAHLRAVAYRMLGSLSEAEDAVQESWLRLDRSQADDIENLRAWLTRVVARVCLDVLRSRKSRAEEALEDGSSAAVAPKPSRSNPEQEAMLADSVGLALLVVLDRLSPAERLAFVLHDLFDFSFDEVASLLDRSPEAARQLASRARRRVRGTGTEDVAQRARQRETAKTFLAALRAGDINQLLSVLDPDVMVNIDGIAAVSRQATQVRGARAWAENAIRQAKGARFAWPAAIDGTVGIVVAPYGRLFRVLKLSFNDDKIAGVEVIGDREALDRMELSMIDEPPAGD